MFTSIPTELAISIAKKKLQMDETLDERTGLTIDDILQLLSLFLNATFITFKGEFYRQIHGTAMGSPVSVIVADLVMECVEERALRSFRKKLRFWKR